MSEGALEHFAKLLARADHAEGEDSYRHGGWGIAFVAWAVKVREEHGSCGPLDISGIEAFKRGETNAVAIVCPVHGDLVGPEMPEAARTEVAHIRLEPTPRNGKADICSCGVAADFCDALRAKEAAGV